jgi:MFS family permease
METTGRRNRVVVASMIDNVMASFVFYCFGYLMSRISTYFTPFTSPASNLLLSSAPFGAFFLAQPIGTLVFGPYADRGECRSARFFVLLLMNLSTLLIGITLTHQSVGIAGWRSSLSHVPSKALTSAESWLWDRRAARTCVEKEKRPLQHFHADVLCHGGALAAASGFLITQFFGAEQLGGWKWHTLFLNGCRKELRTERMQ